MKEIQRPRGTDSGIVLRQPDSEEDWRLIRELCCRTGDNGLPIARARWPFFGELWVGPYQRLLPSWTHAAYAGDVLVGYLTGCNDTVSFQRRRLFGFDVPLLIQVVRGKYERNSDTLRFTRRTLGLEKGPESCFPKEIIKNLRKKFPAHLHMNVDGACRGMGIGKRLAEKYFASLRAVNVPGIHVYCGADPLIFYKRLGFEEVAEIGFKPSRAGSKPSPVYALGYRL